MAEVKVWIGLREEIIRRRRRLWLAAGVAAGIVACVLPWSTTVRVPALLDDRDMAHLHPIRPAMIAAVHAGVTEPLGSGAPVVTLVAPDLEQEITLTRQRIEATAMRLQRRAGSAEDRAATLVLQQTLDGLVARLSGLQTERHELEVKMPFAGRLVELSPSLHVGRWLQRSDMIGLAAGGQGCRVRGYVSEDHVARIDVTVPARFVAEEAWAGSATVTLRAIATAGSTALELLELASPYGGGVAARMTGQQNTRAFSPVVGQFLVAGEVTTTAACAEARAVRGTLHVTAKAESLAARAWRQVLKVLVRESGV